MLAVRLLPAFDLALPSSPPGWNCPPPCSSPWLRRPPGFRRRAPASAPARAAENLPAGQVQPAPAPAVSTREALAALALVWLAGAALCGVWYLGSSLRFYRRAVLARPQRTGHPAAGSSASQDLGVQRPPAGEPAVPCPWRRAFSSPPCCCSRGAGPRRSELCAAARADPFQKGDLWYRLVLLAAACLHWFNPLVWLLLRQAWRRIWSCAVTTRCCAPLPRAAPRFIARLWPAFAEPGPGPALTTYFRGGKGSLARRFSNILAPGKKTGGRWCWPPPWSSPLFGALVGCSVAPLSAPRPLRATPRRLWTLRPMPGASAQRDRQPGQHRHPVRPCRAAWRAGAPETPALKASLQLPEAGRFAPPPTARLVGATC